MLDNRNLKRRAEAKHHLHLFDPFCSFVYLTDIVYNVTHRIFNINWQHCFSDSCMYFTQNILLSAAFRTTVALCSLLVMRGGFSFFGPSWPLISWKCTYMYNIKQTEVLRTLILLLIVRVGYWSAAFIVTFFCIHSCNYFHNNMK